MIAPDVVIENLDPEGFGWLCQLLAARDRSGPVTVTVLHARGSIVRAVDEHRGLLNDAEVASVNLADPDATREALGVDRVVFVERDHLAAIDQAVNDLARNCATQGELLWRAREIWNASPGVVQSPAPAPSVWPALAERLAGVPDGQWIVAECTGAPSWTLGARVEAGVVTAITSAVPDDAITALRFRLSADRWERVLTAPDPLTTLDVELETNA